MRRYLAEDEELLRARRAVEAWASAGLLRPDQAAALDASQPSELRQVHPVVRILLGIFTLAALGALVGLCATLFDIQNKNVAAALCITLSGLTYGAAELLVSRKRLYRCGVEEGLALGALALFCAGAALVMENSSYSLAQRWLPWIAALGFSMLYVRFGYLYAAVGGLLSIAVAVTDLAWSPELARILLAALFAVGLMVLRPIRRRHRDDFRDREYGILQALLWVGLYLSINQWAVQLGLFRGGATLGWRAFPSCPVWLYFTTYALVWLLPAAALWQGLADRDRPLIDTGLILFLLTLITNKPYLGWARREWDPIVLGCGLVLGAVLVRRWLSRGEVGQRYGYRATKLTGMDPLWADAMAMGAVLIPGGSAHHSMDAPRPNDFHGGSSGGGGASGDY